MKVCFIDVSGSMNVERTIKTSMNVGFDYDKVVCFNHEIEAIYNTLGEFISKYENSHYFCGGTDNRIVKEYCRDNNVDENNSVIITDSFYGHDGYVGDMKVYTID